MGIRDQNIIKNKENQNDAIGFFSLLGRENRLNFFKVYILVFLFGVINIIYFLPGSSSRYVTGFIIVYLLLLIATFPITVRRLHDSNLHGGYYLINLIPSGLSFIDNSMASELSFLCSIFSIGFGIYFLYLVLRTGSPDENDYGVPNPVKKYGNKTINSICIGLFTLIIASGIMATVI